MHFIVGRQIDVGSTINITTFTINCATLAHDYSKIIFGNTNIPY